MGAMVEVSGAMHLVKEIPIDDDRKLTGMARVYLRSGIDLVDMTEFARDAYKIGRETEARRHQCFVIGSLEDAEYIAIMRAMEAERFHPLKAAGILKIAKTTMYRKLKYYGIDYGQKTQNPEEVSGE